MVTIYEADLPELRKWFKSKEYKLSVLSTQEYVTKSIAKCVFDGDDFIHITRLFLIN